MSYLGALGNWVFSFIREYLLEWWDGAGFIEHGEDERENDVQGDGEGCEVNPENNAAESNQCLQESDGKKMINIHINHNSGFVVIGDNSSINSSHVADNVPQSSSVSLNELHENTGQHENFKSAESSAFQEAEIQRSANTLLPANSKQGNENKIGRRKKKAAGQAIVKQKIPSLIRRLKYIQETLSQCRGKGEWKIHHETIECLMKEYNHDDDNYDIVLYLKYEKAVSLYQRNERHSSYKSLRKVVGEIKNQSTIMSETQIWIYIRCLLLVSDIYCQDKKFGKAKKALDEAKKALDEAILKFQTVDEANNFLVKFASINQALLETEFYLAYARYYLEQVDQQNDHSRHLCVENVIKETKKAENVANIHVLKKDNSDMWKELHMEISITRSNAILKLSNDDHKEHDEHNETLKETLEKMDCTLYNKSLPITKVKFRALKCSYYKTLGNLEQAAEQAKEGLGIAEECGFLVEKKQLEGQIKEIDNSLSVESQPCMKSDEVVSKATHMITTDTGNVESNAVEQSCDGPFNTDYDFTTDSSSDNEEDIPTRKSICGRNEALECFSDDPVQGHSISREKMVGDYSSCQDLVTDGEGNLQRYEHSVVHVWPSDDENLTEREQTRLATHLDSFHVCPADDENLSEREQTRLATHLDSFHVCPADDENLSEREQTRLATHLDSFHVCPADDENLSEREQTRLATHLDSFHVCPADDENLSEREQTRLATHLGSFHVCPADDENLTEREQTRLATHLGSSWMQLLGLLNIGHETKENILRNTHCYPDIESQAKEVLHIYNNRGDFSRKDLAKLVEQDLQLYDEAKAIISGKYQSLEEKKDIKTSAVVEGEECERNEVLNCSRAGGFHGSLQTINVPADKEKLSEREQTRLAKHLNPHWSELLGLLNIDHHMRGNLSNFCHYPDNISKAKEVLHIYNKRRDFSRKHLAKLVKEDLTLFDEAEAILSGTWKSI